MFHVSGFAFDQTLMSSKPAEMALMSRHRALDGIVAPTWRSGEAVATGSDLRICVYTCLIGRTELLNEQPVAASSNVPFICFTDDPDRRSHTWEIRPISPLLTMDSIRSQRAVKLRPHEHLLDFDASVYIDNGVLLKLTPEKIVEQHLPDCGFSLPRHSFRETVLDEFLAVSDQGLDDSARIFEQLNHYALCDSEGLQEKPYWTAILLRDHRKPAVRELLDLWLAHVQRYSRRDQLSLNFVLRQCGLSPGVLMIDNHDSDLHSWPHKTNAHQAMRVHRPVAAYGTLSARIRELELNFAAERQQERERTDMRIVDLTRAEQAAAARIEELEVLLGEEKSKHERRVIALLAETQNHTSRIAELLAEKQSLEKQVCELATGLSVARYRIAVIHNSISWRVTKPIRKIHNILGLEAPGSSPCGTTNQPLGADD
jgi:hypothetical protein